MYDYIIVTHIPAFYKVNLYNELANKLNILVVFISSNTNEERADDFLSLNNAKFKYELLHKGNFQTREVFQNIIKLKNILKNNKYKRILVSGWDLKEFWYIILTNATIKNYLALESTINESRIDGIRGWIKKIFLSRISTIFASGNLHKSLVDSLNYKGKVLISKGVGIINKPIFTPIKREYKKRFLFIGRLSFVKNLEVLIKVFNSLENYNLTIIGEGEDKEYLKSISHSNIIFKGAIDNINIKNHILEHDVFILPSVSETWGLVAEEALYFGLPVIISEKAGASELIVDNFNGFIINPLNKYEIRNTILRIDYKVYQELILNIDKLSIFDKDILQVKAYNLD